MENQILNRQQPVASVVLDHSECAQVFQRHRIDFCCQGEQSIEAAANARKVDVDALLAELSRAIADRRGDRQDDPRVLSTPRLVAYIVSKHHEYLRKALPFIQALATKVSRVHGDHNPKLRHLEAAVQEISAALLPHLDDEEQSLFPALTAQEPDPAAIASQLASMQDEHLAVARLLERIRAASDEFTLPEWACNSYNTLFSELRQLESDVFTHVHLENHVLKPRFAE
jgi:regulator of cell morphogenesis and NO signaling